LILLLMRAFVVAEAVGGVGDDGEVAGRAFIGHLM
jgi:hypothetical protein